MNSSAAVWCAMNDSLPFVEWWSLRFTAASVCVYSRCTKATLCIVSIAGCTPFSCNARLRRATTRGSLVERELRWVIAVALTERAASVQVLCYGQLRAVGTVAAMVRSL